MWFIGRLVKEVEYFFFLRRFDSRTVVFDRDRYRMCFRIFSEGDQNTVFGKFHGIGQQVTQHFGQCFPVGANPDRLWSIVGELYPLLLSCRCKTLYSFFHQIIDVEPGVLGGKSFLFGFRKIQYLIYQVQ